MPGADSPGTVRRAECRTHGYEIVVLLQETTTSRYVAQIYKHRNIGRERKVKTEAAGVRQGDSYDSQQASDSYR